ncbi:hypothetical protein HFO56_02080 [Rhizobium laguerreae]|uniref:hypothetical protein n=1 Tax=Rhizobium laguerreae TaxID=1076926 RepID=UPI001C9086C5|nr:hypothetical protein [Rhizobium laguerreae]MBY3151195.1 hypothetical protein [Rhizobium laguerreae]
MDREYFLVRRSGDTSLVAADQLDQLALRERDRVIGFPIGMNSSDRERLVRLARRRFAFSARPFKAADVELLVALTGSRRMVCAEVLFGVSKYVAINAAFFAAVIGFCSVQMLHKFAAVSAVSERSLLTPEKTYSNFVAKTKVKGKPDLDIEATKKDMEDYRKWREGVKDGE